MDWIHNQVCEAETTTTGAQLAGCVGYMKMLMVSAERALLCKRTD